MKNVRRDDWESLKPTVHGWGINDVNYTVQIKKTVAYSNGKQKQKTLWVCPYYRDWKEMLKRGHCPKYRLIQPTYSNCIICEEWKYLSNFIKWVDSQPNKDWVNCSLDKDFLSSGVKYYSPETCVYVLKRLNSFTVGNDMCRNGLMLGVSIKNNKYYSQCHNPFSTRERYIGYFATELEAHKAWQAKKHEHALRLAEEQQDPRVANALRERYAPDKDWTNK